MLDKSQIRRYEQDGALFVDGVFDAGEVEILRAAGDRIAHQERANVTPEAAGSSARMVHGAHAYEPAFTQLCRHPRLIEPAMQLIGTGLYVHQSRLNYNAGLGTGGFDWHQDYSTWHNIDGLAEPRAMMIAVFLDDVDATNGPLLYIPGSHNEGLIDDFEPVEDATGNVLMKLSANRLRQMVERGGIIAGTGPAGSVLFMHCNLVHGSSANISPRRRSLFYVNVNSVENPQTTFKRAEYHAGSDFSPIIPADDGCLLPLTV
ncbi:MAG: phytanoyl-CoA dioxygenase family protein [Proteobacteria bacterium]|nr:phytanoyl-CoA dioxygenase family protein [Pseudomonadota bacterium]MDA1057443.1 phytanoyl-CoA dioxygenase family protein [Pseudomonadota bacterium]